MQETLLLSGGAKAKKRFLFPYTVLCVLKRVESKTHTQSNKQKSTKKPTSCALFPSMHGTLIDHLNMLLLFTTARAGIIGMLVRLIQVQHPVLRHARMMSQIIFYQNLYSLSSMMEPSKWQVFSKYSLILSKFLDRRIPSYSKDSFLCCSETSYF